MIKIIMHVGPHGEIGYENKTIYQNPIDYQLFKALTCANNSTLIAGRCTAESMKNVLPVNRVFKYVSCTKNSTIGKHNQWEHISPTELTKYLNSDKTYISNDIYLIGGSYLLDMWGHFAEEAIIMVDHTFNYQPCDTYWHPDNFFKKQNKIFQYGTLECWKWIRK